MGERDGQDQGLHVDGVTALVRLALKKRADKGLAAGLDEHALITKMVGKSEAEQIKILSRELWLDFRERYLRPLLPIISGISNMEKKALIALRKQDMSSYREFMDKRRRLILSLPKWHGYHMEINRHFYA